MTSLSTAVISSTFIIVSCVILFGTVGAAELRSNDPSVNEAPCKDVPPAADLMTYFSWPILSQPNSFFLYFASQSFLRLHTEILLRRPAKNQKEVDTMCLQMYLSDLVSTVIGYDDKIFVNRAAPDERGNLNDTNVQAQRRQESGITVIKNDGWANETISWANQDHVLLTRCVNGIQKDWVVASTKLITPEVKKKVLEVVKKLGFNPSLAWDVTDKDQLGREPVCRKNLMKAQEVAAEALELFHSYDADNPLSKKLESPIPYQGNVYDTLGQYYEAMLSRKKASRPKSQEL